VRRYSGELCGQAAVDHIAEPERARGVSFYIYNRENPNDHAPNTGCMVVITHKEVKLYGFAFTLALIALIAAVLGFGGLAGSLANIAMIVFVVALIGTIILFVLGWKAAKKIIS
jgi:uncharacterized membrane protein YtjA (UPF0391 family)